MVKGRAPTTSPWPLSPSHSRHGRARAPARTRSAGAPCCCMQAPVRLGSAHARPGTTWLPFHHDARLQSGGPSQGPPELPWPSLAGRRVAQGRVVAIDMFLRACNRVVYGFAYFVGFALAVSLRQHFPHGRGLRCANLRPASTSSAESAEDSRITASSCSWRTATGLPTLRSRHRSHGRRDAA